MPIDAVVFVVIMIGIIVGVGTYKHYKKKARLAAEKNQSLTVGGSGSGQQTESEEKLD